LSTHIKAETTCVKREDKKEMSELKDITGITRTLGK